MRPISSEVYSINCRVASSEQSNIVEALRSSVLIILKEAFSKGLISAILSGAEDLFALPSAAKDELRVCGTQDVGYTPFGVARALDTGIPNLFEALTFDRCITRLPKGLAHVADA